MALIRLLLALAVLAIGAIALAIARTEPGFSFGGGSVGASAALLGAGYALAACGLFFWARQPGNRCGPLLVAAGTGWLLIDWNNPGSGSSLAFFVGLLLYASAPPLVAHAALAFPVGRLASAAERAALALAYAGAVLVLGVAAAAVFDPVAQGCGDCPRNLMLVHDDAGAYEALNRYGVRAGLGWSVVLATLVLWRLARSSPARRRAAAPVLGAGVAYLSLVAASFATSIDSGLVTNAGIGEKLWLAQAGALGTFVVGVTAGWVRGRATRAAVARVVVELAGSPAPEGLGDVLARSLGDPGLEVAYPLGGGERYVDAGGRQVDLSEGSGRSVTPLVRAGRTVAVLAHRRGLLDDPGLVEEIAAAARLALEHERLQAEVRAQLEDLRASRARIVATANAERRRLERDLHDGAQQRLVGLALSLRLARGQLGGSPRAAELVEQAEVELRGAVANLRELAHGIFPAMLHDEGLAAALEALAEGAHVPVGLGSLPERRLPDSVEAAAYFVVAEALRRGAAPQVTVDAEISGTDLLVTVHGSFGELDRVIDLEDRVGALDGTLDLERNGQGEVTIRAVIPCGS